MHKVYAVSGSASGIGKAVAEALVRQGNQVIRIDLANADICADLSTADGRDQCARALLAAAPDGLDGLVPCAGVGGFMGLSDKVLEVNFAGSVDLLQAALPLLQARRGAVVVIGSNSMAMPGQDVKLIEFLLNDQLEAAKQWVAAEGIEPYPSAKTALCIWMREKAIAWAAKGVRMNAIAPGITETNMTATQRNLSPELAEQLKAFADSAPIGHAAQPDAIADVILFLLSPQARNICGEVLYADGGHAALFRPRHV